MMWTLYLIVGRFVLCQNPCGGDCDQNADVQQRAFICLRNRHCHLFLTGELRAVN